MQGGDTIEAHLDPEEVVDKLPIDQVAPPVPEVLRCGAGQREGSALRRARAVASPWHASQQPASQTCSHRAIQPSHTLLHVLHGVSRWQSDKSPAVVRRLALALSTCSLAV